MILINILESVERPALFFFGLFGDRWVEKWIRTDDVFETNRF